MPESSQMGLDFLFVARFHVGDFGFNRKTLSCTEA
jgi:hypothetical protein